jgi:2-polyprenyl-6-hydroxyphenyl methylase/3-demethylubiquinone-9 3-methyltransferase
VTGAVESFVRARFDEVEARFKAEVAGDDVRLQALLHVLGPLEGRRVLDLGCGKGRFARHLERLGATVVGLDLSRAMLAKAPEIHRVRGTARRLPFGDTSFDHVVAIETLEHVPMRAEREALAEMARVLVPGGLAVIVDKNAGSLNAKRPWLPNLAMKWIDERRGRWMYPRSAVFRERWFWPQDLRLRLLEWFADVQVEFLMTPGEATKRVFRRLACCRLFTLWSARKAGGGVE